MSRWGRTHEALQRSALDLFQTQGYESTGTAQIAAAAGVSEMTLFRHFPNKASLLLDDPFDPLLAETVFERPAAEPAMVAVVEGVRSAWRTIAPAEAQVLRARLQVVASAPSLQAAMHGSSGKTVEALADAMRRRGVDLVEARVAAAAVVAGLSSALLEWSRTEVASLDEVVGRALDTMRGR